MKEVSAELMRSSKIFLLLSDDVLYQGPHLPTPTKNSVSKALLPPLEAQDGLPGSLWSQTNLSPLPLQSPLKPEFLSPWPPKKQRVCFHNTCLLPQESHKPARLGRTPSQLEKLLWKQMKYPVHFLKLNYISPASRWKQSDLETEWRSTVLVMSKLEFHNTSKEKPLNTSNFKNTT